MQAHLDQSKTEPLENTKSSGAMLSTGPHSPPLARTHSLSPGPVPLLAYVFLQETYHGPGTFKMLGSGANKDG